MPIAPQPTGRLLAAPMIALVCCLGLVGCVGPDPESAPPRELEMVPRTQPSEGGPGASVTASPADAEQCSRVADVYLSTTLLPLADEREDDADRPSLRETAEQLEDAAETLPAEVRSGFLAAADGLRDAGEELQPEELAEVSGSLAPVDAWLAARCSTD